MNTVNPTRSKILGWIFLAIFVAIWDIVACLTGGRTLSESYGSALLNPKIKWFVVASTVYLVTHLNMNIVPTRARIILRHADPLLGLGVVLRSQKVVREKHGIFVPGRDRHVAYVERTDAHLAAK